MTSIEMPVRTVFKKRSALPGFVPAFAYTIFYLSAIVLIPLAALAIRPWSLGLDGVFAVVTTPRVLAALKLSFGAAAIAATVNTVFGLIVTWVLVRYDFPLKRLVDALVDLPFALPTAVAGIALASLYSDKGLIGRPLAELGVKIAYTPFGVVLALTFIGLPFVVRTLQPVLSDLGLEAEEAAATLGATRLQTFRRIVLPALLPALLTGAGLAFARAVGEYGSVIFIAGNLPMISEIAPLLIIIKLQQFDYAAASAIALVMLGTSFSALLALNVFQSLLAAKR